MDIKTLLRPREADDARRTVVTFLLLAAAAAFYVYQAASFWNQVNDDAYITFRYSLNLARGVGPYYNPAERVEGYTNFLLMLLLASVIGIGGAAAAPGAAKIVGILAGIVALVGSWRLATG